MRARNYKIKEGPRHEIKMIAGKIIPAIATATALIVGFNGMEIIKSILDLKFESRKMITVNLASNMFV